MINESVQDKIIRELKDENKKLKEMIKAIAKQSAGGGMVDLKALGIENMEELLENMEENEKILEDMETPWEEKLAAEKEKDDKKRKETGMIEENLSDDEENFTPEKKKSNY
jgi:molybdenum-dependent DNA-binding transcriptional regulator ModE